MSVEELTTYEVDRTLKNVMEVCKDLAQRIQDSPGPKGTIDQMSDYQCQSTNMQFFNDKTYFTDYLKASASKMVWMPGYANYSKILTIQRFL